MKDTELFPWFSQLVSHQDEDWMLGGMFNFRSFQLGWDSVVLLFDLCFNVPGLQYRSATGRDKTAEMHFFFEVLEI